MTPEHKRFLKFRAKRWAAMRRLAVGSVLGFFAVIAVVLTKDPALVPNYSGLLGQVSVLVGAIVASYTGASVYDAGKEQNSLKTFVSVTTPPPTVTTTPQAPPNNQESKG